MSTYIILYYKLMLYSFIIIFIYYFFFIFLHYPLYITYYNSLHLERKERKKKLNLLQYNNTKNK